jgi:hypothetical protein
MDLMQFNSKPYISIFVVILRENQKCMLINIYYTVEENTEDLGIRLKFYFIFQITFVYSVLTDFNY